MKTRTIIILSLIAVIVIGFVIYRTRKNSGSGQRQKCGNVDSNGFQIYTGDSCLSTGKGSYSVTSGGNGIWAYGDHGCYCNTNAISNNPNTTSNTRVVQVEFPQNDFVGPTPRGGTTANTSSTTPPTRK